MSVKVIEPFEHTNEYYIEHLENLKPKPFYTAVKRIFDFVLALFCLIVLCVPMLIIGIVVVSTSKGGAFYVQERLTVNGKTFKLIKFRSMVFNAEENGPQWSLNGDDRTTRVGRFLRRFHLDELPQVVCILKGDMSFVGPRPEREVFYEAFETYIHGFRERLHVKPGLTGLAQVHGLLLRPEEKIQYDIEYIKNRSFWLDLKIVLQTFGLIFRQEHSLDSDTKRVLFVATVVKTHIAEFHIPYLKLFKEMGYTTEVCARNDYDDPSECVIPYCDVFHDIAFERNPWNFRNMRAYFSLSKIIRNGNYSIIHCHTPVGGVFARVCARAARRKGTKVIYTAHGFHFYNHAPLLNWLAYYPIEWICAHWTDVLITINSEDYERAKKSMHAKRVEYVPGVGVDTKTFYVGALSDSEKLNFRKSLGLSDLDKMVVSVGELIHRKNHIAVLQALHELKDPHIHYFICGRGELSDYLSDQIRQLGLSDTVHLLGYREDVASVCSCADLFILPSLQEGLPVALMEAMLLGVPCIASDIRGNRDLLQSAYSRFDAKNVSEIASRIRYYLNHDRTAMIATDTDYAKQFGLDRVLEKMRDIYCSLE